MSAVASLLSAQAVRERSALVFRRGIDDRLGHFTVDLDRLPAAAAYVADTIRQNYPDLKVPPHARWRHFTVQGFDAWEDLRRKAFGSSNRIEIAKSRLELAITSVLLDAGAGPAWHWTEHARPGHGGKPGPLRIGRSEGLALASLHVWASGLFSSVERSPYRADAKALKAIDVPMLSTAFQVGADNPLEGLDGRVALLVRLGETIEARPDLFGGEGRLGGLFDTLAARAVGDRIAAAQVLALVLDAFGPIWPGRPTLDGVDLGDTWHHSAIDIAGPTHGLIPFHKLSQWLTYSLLEPLQEADLTVTDPDGLTGLAEYRNGGLFIDLGVITPRDPGLARRPRAPGEEPIVEWRALTVSLLDEIAPLVRGLLGRTAAEMPLASVLEGGTWAAGRRIARQLRRDGGPPLAIISDGSVF